MEGDFRYTNQPVQAGVAREVLDGLLTYRKHYRPPQDGHDVLHGRGELDRVAPLIDHPPIHCIVDCSPVYFEFCCATGERCPSTHLCTAALETTPVRRQ